ncbi:MAG: RNA polymerase sigma factor, partial [Pyrinomonadaceae bacterium]
MTINTATYPIWQNAEGASKAATEKEVAPMSDYALAQRAAGGDLSAFEVLYERHNRRVYSLCLRMTQNVAEAEDLAQEAFIQLFRK